MTLFLVFSLYFSVLLKLVHDWYVLPDFSHGFLIPIFVGYLVWARSKKLQEIAVSPTWLGLWLLLPGLALLLLGVLGSELFLARLSFLLVASGMIWLLAGGRMLMALRLPLAVCLLAIPIPQVIFNQVALPLQLLSSWAASAVLPLFHVPVFREGNIIRLPSISLEVAEACSGIRSLMSLFTLAVLYGYFAERSNARRWILIACSVPVAVCANMLRIVGTGLLVQQRGAEVALGFFHEFSGLLMFLFSLVLLLILHAAMNAHARRTA
ncbi:exosortase/archaeosortase family protein [Terriglobus roseus]|nr:exosortase/archaeosortase family protein [Terriglobus roseus]